MAAPLLALLIAAMAGACARHTGVTYGYLTPGSKEAWLVDQLPKQRTVRQEEARYRAAAHRFVELAQAGDVEGMVAMQSPITLRKEGEDTMRRVLRDNVASKFRDAAVEWAARSGELRIDEMENWGLLFHGRIVRAEPYEFAVLVMKEKGKHVVLGLGPPSLFEQAWLDEPNAGDASQ